MKQCPLLHIAISLTGYIKCILTRGIFTTSVKCYAIFPEGESICIVYKPEPTEQEI